MYFKLCLSKQRVVNNSLRSVKHLQIRHDFLVYFWQDRFNPLPALLYALTVLALALWRHKERFMCPWALTKRISTDASCELLLLLLFPAKTKESEHTKWFRPKITLFAITLRLWWVSEGKCFSSLLRNIINNIA